LKQSIADDRLHIHLPEGAIFLWLWFEGLSITTSELYEQLKQVGLLVVPGKYFFPGQHPVSEHAECCIRMNYAQSEEDLRTGIDILSRVLTRYW
jgi:valine--pyruvate aminotransferase